MDSICAGHAVGRGVFSLLFPRLFRKCLKHKRRALRLKDCQLVEWGVKHGGRGKGTQWRRNRERCRE